MSSDGTTRSDICEFFRLLHSAGTVAEIRSPNCPDKRGGTFRATASAYCDDAEIVAKLAKAIDNRQPAGIYVTINPVVPELLARSANQIDLRAKNTTADADILRRSNLFIDVDSVRSAGVSATEEEMQAALDLARRIAHGLVAEGWPAPLLGMSGNGGYLFYRIDLPNDDESTDLVRRVLIGLGERFDTETAKIDRGTFNASRIAKVLGTTARKGSDFKGGEGNPARPHRQSWFEPPKEPLATVSRELLEAVASEDRPRSAVGTAPSVNGSHKGGKSAIIRCRKYVAKMPDAISGQRGHGAILAAAAECFRFGLSQADALELMQEFNATKTGVELFSDRELEHKLVDALKKVNEAGEFGMRLKQHAKQNGKPARPARMVVPPSGPGKIPPLRLDESQTDLMQGRRLVALHGEDFLYIEEREIYAVWDGQRFNGDHGPRMESLAKDIPPLLLREITATAEQCDRISLESQLRFFKYSASSKGIANAIKMARSEPGILLSVEKLDSDHWLLNLPNGTLDLKTVTLRPHDRKDRLTKLCPTPYDPKADCPLWCRTVETITDHNPQLQRYLQRSAGYWLTGLCREHILEVFYGCGANGKTTYLEALRDVLGPEYAMMAPAELLVLKRKEHSTERADLFGKRLVICSETENGQHLAESLAKSMTGGERQRARKVFENNFEFDQTWKIVICTNHKLQIRGTDHGIWRRLKLVPFNVTIPEAEQDKALPEKLKAEASGILNWCLIGLAGYLANGLGEPAEVTKATAGYRAEMDVLQRFIDEGCSVGPGRQCRASALYAAFQEWCKTSGEDVVTERNFRLAITEKGFQRKPSNGIWYVGVAPLSDRNEEETTYQAELELQ